MREPPALRLVFVLLLAIAVAQALAGCRADPIPLSVDLPAHVEPRSIAAVAVVRPVEPLRIAPVDHRSTWCEPIDLTPCSSTADCSANSTCVSAWWDDGERVCARREPELAERSWREDRLRVVVDHVCPSPTFPGNDTDDQSCDSVALLRYVITIASRETSMRPDKRARSRADRAANRRAWIKHRDAFASNPAATDPERWSTGLGYFAQNPSLWLPRWSVDAPPEVLCGEVEATEVHLRAARDQVRKIEHGVQCDGETYFGSACDDHGCRPSWYDASRANSGKVCPGDAAHRERFETRARRHGLDPWAPITTESLGREIPSDRQDQIAAMLRGRMEAVDRHHGR